MNGNYYTSTSSISGLITTMSPETLDPTSARPRAPSDCPIYSRQDDALIEMFSFWIEGVLQCCVAIGGLFGNLISGVILSK